MPGETRLTPSLTESVRARLDTLGAESLVEIDGRAGLFVPLDDDEVEATTPALRKLVAALRAEVARLGADNAALQAEIVRLKAAPQPSDDLAGAVQHSLDSLQTRLSQTTNPTSSFAVKEFVLDAAVAVEMNALGRAGYRFVAPGEKIEAASISRLKLTVVPLPRASTEGALSRPAFVTDRDVEDVIGIGDVYRKQLQAHGIFTVNDLVATGSRARTRAELATLLRIDAKKLGYWLEQAEMLMLEGMSGREAATLQELGFTGLAGLAEASAPELTTKLKERLGEHASTLAEARVGSWVTAAKGFVGRKMA